tara:strand:- start:687 stop:1496 length:810 start_codon:yes stop_codon:yes gene_type:complete
MRIYIPTFRRVDNQIAYNNLPDDIKENVILVVQEQERELFKIDCEYLVVGNNIGISKTREHIYRHADKNRFGMIDDDMLFYRRNAKYSGGESNMEKSRRDMNSGDWKYWFNELNKMFDEKDIMHIGHREIFLPPMGVKYYFNNGIFGVHWIDGSKLNNFIDEVDWCHVKIGEDIILILECLFRGYKNVITDEIIRTGWDGTQRKGGCESFRTAKVGEVENMKLVKKYKGFYKFTNNFYENKKLGRLRKFKVNYDLAYKSSQMNTLKDYM